MQINNLDHKCLRAGHNFQQNINYVQGDMVSLDRYLLLSQCMQTLHV